MSDISKIQVKKRDNSEQQYTTSEYDIKDGLAIANITRSGTTFTATRRNGTTFTFSQQDNNNNTIPQAICTTPSGTGAKVADCSNYVLTSKTYLMVIMANANTYNGAITLNVNSQGAKTIYINGVISSSSNKTLPAGSYLIYYDGTNYYFRTDGKITGSITGDATTVNGKTVAANVPADAKFTDTTYTPYTSTPSNIASNGSAGDSNNYARGDHTHAIAVSTGEQNGEIKVAGQSVKVKGLGAAAYLGTVTSVDTTGNIPTSNAVKTFVEGKGYTTNTGTITGIKMNDSSKGTSGVVDLGTVITSHQTISNDGVTGSTINRYGTCSIANSTAAKTVSITNGSFTLSAGSRVTVKFSYQNTANNPTLNVNGTGAKNIFCNGSQITTGSNKSLLAGTVEFIYDGTQWHLIGGGSNIPAVTTSDSGKFLRVNSSGAWVAEEVQDAESIFPTDNDILDVPNGGTGVATLASGEVLVGAGRANVTTRPIDATGGGTSDSTSLVSSGAVYESRVLIITISSYSGSSVTVSDSRIKSEHVVINSLLSNPSAQTDDWTVNTSNGSLTLSGTASGSTSVTLYLMLSQA